MTNADDDFWADLPSKPAQKRRATRRRRWPWMAAALVVLVGVALGLHAIRSASHPAEAATAAQSNPAGSPTPSTPARADPAANPKWTFTTLSGQTATLASERGRPVMLWFITAGCASCAVSIPAVAQHIKQLGGDGVQVLALDLYGDLDPAPKGISELTEFARSTAGVRVAPNWTWGLASKPLSLAFDPSGTPDEYFLLNPAGAIRYQNSVPVTTMAQLLSAAAHVDTSGGPSTAQPSTAPAPSVAPTPTLP